MELLTLKQAAHAHYSCGSIAEIGSGERAKYEDKNESFIKGAEWQKEQYAVIKKAMQIVLSCLQNATDRDYERDILQTACDAL